MLTDTFLRYKNGCLKLFVKEGDTISFVGTGFIVHEKGYLVTVAHILYSQQNLVAVAEDTGDGFVPVVSQENYPMPVNVVDMDYDRDIALLKFDTDVNIEMPDHMIGTPDDTVVGNLVSCVGYPFGFHHVFNQTIQSAIVSAKINSRNETNIFLFNTMIHLGTRGGPLVDVEEGRVIGVVAGQFDPLEAAPKFMKEEELPDSNFSYAVSIEYAAALLEKHGLDIS
ncbi:S1 family peptidase [Limisalsivibrio acetivorans]|uniref:S1 family peptidase n=1 Tax=Limisalsivibrio acetivorans TaxID=1304888 RepID=UPI0003B67708|nr:serine protease [Limisalsivibrio acetivorans]